MNPTCVIPVVKTPQDYQAFRISPSDSNRLAIVFDSNTANMTWAAKLRPIGISLRLRCFLC
jgi:hypothetical protein